MILYQKLFQELHRAGIRYLVAGGFAVNFHQVQRATMDLDLILHLEESNVLRFVDVMKDLGYAPRLPVKPEDLADRDLRRDWVQNKDMLVFSFINPKMKFEVIDVFIQEPRPFEQLYQRQMAVEAFGATIPVLGLDDLIALKEEAGREKDLFDVSQLKKKKRD
jgi:hypothetical protein